MAWIDANLAENPSVCGEQVRQTAAFFADKFPRLSTIIGAIDFRSLDHALLWSSVIVAFTYLGFARDFVVVDQREEALRRSSGKVVSLLVHFVGN